jgi:hypothetical protein
MTIDKQIIPKATLGLFFSPISGHELQICTIETAFYFNYIDIQYFILNY